MILLDQLYYLIVFVVALIGFIRFKHHSPPYQLLIILLTIAFINDVGGKFMAAKQHNNLPLAHLYALIEYFFITIIYSKILVGRARRVIVAAIIPVAIFAVINSFYLQGINRFPSNFLLVCELVYMIYSFLSFKQMLLNPIQEALHTQSLFWLNLAQIIFSTTLFIYFGTLNYVISHHINDAPLYLLVLVVNIVYVLLLAAAILKDKKEKEYKGLSSKLIP